MAFTVLSTCIAKLGILKVVYRNEIFGTPGFPFTTSLMNLEVDIFPMLTEIFVLKFCFILLDIGVCFMCDVNFCTKIKFLYLDTLREKLARNINYHILIISIYISIIESWVSAVGIATGYGLDDHGSEIFTSPCRPDRLWGPLSLLYNGYRGLVPRK
jgi:hypothetical protein